MAQVTKQGFTYVFDRVTGEPVWPIVERPVATDSDVPGEKPYPTQPFPSKPPAFVDQGVSLDDANDLTPEIKAMAQEQMQKFRLGPLFTPPSLEGNAAAARDRAAAPTGAARRSIRRAAILFVRATRGVGVNRIGKNDGSDPLVDVPYSHTFARGGEEANIDGLPLTSPPYAVLTAVDLNRGEIAWKVPLGEGNAVAAESSAAQRRRTAGAPGVAEQSRRRHGHQSGLVFIGGGDGYFYAFETKTGKEVWRAKIPYMNTANPMTYRTRSGRQFIVMATGMGTENSLIAFALNQP